MSKKSGFILFIMFLFSVSRVAHAAPIINEIMYDLDGTDIDWVEIYNPDSADVDLTSLKLLVSNSTSNHSIANSSGSSVLHQGDYGIIVASSQLSAFTGKWGSSGNVFTSSYTLPNDTGTVQINSGDKTVPMGSVTYNSTQGASGDGNSLQLINGSWSGAVPTPGSVNQASGSGSGNTGDTDTNTDTTSDSGNNNSTGDASTSSSSSGGGGGGVSSPVKKNSPVQKMKAQIIAKQTAYVGIPFALEGMAFGIHGEQLFGGKYFWNFGDGDSRELNALITDKFTHTYFYSGDYDIDFEYYQNYFADIPDVTAKITIKVLVPTVSISSVGGASDFFVELSNDTSYDADLSGWILASDSKSFKIPKNTILAPLKKMIISSRITNFSVADKNTLKLLNPEGYIAYDYSAPVSPAKIVAVNYTPKGSNQSKNLTTAETPTENLLASAISSNPLPNETNSNSSSPIIPIASLVFIGGSAGAVYFIRRKKAVPQAGSDFEILEE